MTEDNREFTLVVESLVAAVDSPDPSSDPGNWPEFSSSTDANTTTATTSGSQLLLLSQSQLLQTIASEIAAFRGDSVADNAPSSPATRAPPVVAQPDEKKQQDEQLQQQQRRARFTARQRGILRRLVIAQNLFRSILQPIVSNLLQAAFKARAQSLITAIVRQEEQASQQQQQEKNSEEQPAERAVTMEQVKPVATALVPLSSIRTRNTLLRLLYEKDRSNSINDEHHCRRFTFHHTVVAFMKAAGFVFKHGGNNNTSADFLEGSWEWSAAPILHALALRVSFADVDPGQLHKVAVELQSALARLKQAETHILAVVERLIRSGGGGALTVERVVLFDAPWLVDEAEEQLRDETLLLKRVQTEILASSASLNKSNSGNNDDDAANPDEALNLVGQVLAARNEARHAAAVKEQQARFDAAKEQAARELEAQRRNAAAEAERQKQEKAAHDRAVAAVQHLLPTARQTLHDTGRVRNSSFQGILFRIQPLSVSTRIHVCDCDVNDGVEVHWHLRAAPNVLYAFTAHLSGDATKFRHLGDEYGYQYNSVPGFAHFGKTTMTSRKVVDDMGTLLKINNDVKPVERCVCGMSFDELWE